MVLADQTEASGSCRWLRENPLESLSPSKSSELEFELGATSQNLDTEIHTIITTTTIDYDNINENNNW